MLLSQAQDRRLGIVERLRLEAHLQLCRGCDNFHKQLDFLRSATRAHPLLRDEDDRDDR